MATASISTSWSVYQDLCLDVIKNKPEYLLQLIKFLKEERPLKEKAAAKEFAQRISKWFSSNSQKWISVCLLSVFLDDFDAEIIWHNVMPWLRFLMQILHSKPKNAFLDVVLRCIQKLLKISLEFEDLSRQISKDSVQPLLNRLLQTTGTKSPCLFNTIAVLKECIISYPGPTGRFRTQIENLCLQLLSNREQTWRKNARECMALLPRCGPSGEKGAKFSETWSRQFKMVVDTLMSLLDGLFQAKSDKDVDEEADSKIYKFTEISLAEPEYSTVTSLQIRSLLCVLEEMISYRFPCMVQIEIGRIMSLCDKIFEKEIGPPQDSSIEGVCLNAVLPQLWCSVLSLMNVLLGQMGSLLLPFENIIIQIANQALAVCETGVDARFKNMGVKIQGYQLLENWNAVVGPLNCEGLKKIVDVIFIDIEPNLEINRPMEGRDEGKEKKRNASYKLHAEIIQGEMAAKKIDDTAGNEVAFAALTLLATLINTSGPVMGADLLLKIETGVIAICDGLMRPSKQTNDNFPAPYGNDKCRKKLLLCAFRLISLYHCHIPTPLSTLIRIFQDYSRDPSVIVSKDSAMYLSLIDKIIHPSVPALREYSEDVVIDSGKSETSMSAPALATGLFDELHAMSHQEASETISQGNEGHQPAKSVISNSVVSGVPEQGASNERVVDNGGVSPMEQLPNDSNLLASEKLDLESQFVLKEKPFVLRNEKLFQENDTFLAGKHEEKQVDFISDVTETLSKRPRLADNMYEEKGQDNVSENLELDSGRDSNMLDAKRENSEMMEVTLSKGEKEMSIKSDDESSLFLKSFVNSFPDSE